MTTSIASPRASLATIPEAPVPIDVVSVTGRWPVACSNAGASSRYAAANPPDVMTLMSSADAAAAVSSSSANVAGESRVRQFIDIFYHVARGGGEALGIRPFGVRIGGKREAR